MHANPFKSRKTLSGVSVRSWRPLTGLRTLSKCVVRPIYTVTLWNVAKPCQGIVGSLSTSGGKTCQILIFLISLI